MLSIYRIRREPIEFFTASELDFFLSHPDGRDRGNRSSGPVASARSGHRSSSDPCGAHTHVDDSACNLASINLMKFRRERRR